MRVSRSSALTLTTTFQKVDFNGTSTYDINTFGNDPTTGNNLVSWDATNKLFKFYDLNDKNYNIIIYFGTSATLLTTPTNLRYRFTVPNGISGGTDLHFPFPDTVGYEDILPISFTSPNNRSHSTTIYLNPAIRTNGLYMEVCLSNTNLGTNTLTECELLLTNFSS